MSEPEKTDINWKIHWIELRSFLSDKWDYAGPVLGFLLGWVVGKVL